MFMLGKGRNVLEEWVGCKTVSRGMGGNDKYHPMPACPWMNLVHVFMSV